MEDFLSLQANEKENRQTSYVFRAQAKNVIGSPMSVKSKLAHGGEMAGHRAMPRNRQS
jgi:hypothetical protein